MSALRRWQATSLAISLLPQIILVRTRRRLAHQRQPDGAGRLRDMAGTSHRSRPRPAATLLNDVGGVAIVTNGMPLQVPAMSMHAFAEPAPIANDEPAMDYLTRLRIAVASDRLANGWMPIAVAAPTVGHDSESPFGAASSA
jgi:AraC-like DNA-binding protein